MCKVLRLPQSLVGQDSLNYLFFFICHELGSIRRLFFIFFVLILGLLFDLTKSEIGWTDDFEESFMSL